MEATINSLLSTFAPVIGLAVCCVSHVVTARSLLRNRPYWALLLGFVCGLAVTAAVTFYALHRQHAAWVDQLALSALNLLAFASLGWCYFHFVNLCIASLRIRVLEEIIDAGGELSAVSLSALYDSRRMTGMRIERLTSGGHLQLRDGRYYSGKPQFLIVARIFELLRRGIIGPVLVRRPAPSGHHRSTHN